MNRVLPLAIIILEKSAIVIASILLIGWLVVWVVSDWLWWLYDRTIYPAYITLWTELDSRRKARDLWPR